jgi:MFS family permease
MWGPTWEWIVAANVLLGINQGLSWSMTVIMKVDLVGPRQRGLAVGLNEFAGYLAVGVTAFLTGYLATLYGLRPIPFYLGIGYAAAGLLLSAMVVRDTREHVALERSQHPRIETALSFTEVFLRTSLTDRNLFAASQAGLVNNLNDGMSWGIFPLFFAADGLSVERIGILKGVYPAIWGMLQVITGPLSDRWGRKGLIAAGMWVQSLGLLAVAALSGFAWWLLGSVLLGIGTAMVYPCLLAAVSDAADPTWRARALSVYRFWRDLGYAIGALTAGLLAGFIRLAWTIAAIGLLTFVSGVVVAALMQEHPRSPLASGLPADH